MSRRQLVRKVSCTTLGEGTCTAIFLGIVRHCSRRVAGVLVEAWSGSGGQPSRGRRLPLRPVVTLSYSFSALRELAGRVLM